MSKYFTDRQLVADAGVLYAIDPVDAHNWLDGSEYDEKHGVDANASKHLAEAYLAHVPSDNLSILEVGCGSGFLTMGLEVHPRVARVVAVDISKKFLSQARDRLPANGKTTLVCADLTDDTLFKQGLFDAALGNSFLHHIYDYEGFLTALLRVIRPGGKVIFSEPCQQGKSLVSFFCAVMMQMDKASPVPLFSERDCERIGWILEIGKREATVRNNPEKKLEWEDKHCFDTRDLERVAKRLGFAGFESFNTGAIQDGLQAEVAATLRLVDVNKPLDRFAGLFDAFQSEYVEMCEPYVETPHQLIVFTR